MNYLNIAKQANDLFSEAPFISKIKSEEDHNKALEFVEILIEDFDNNENLINLISNSIEEYEDSAEEFSEFNIQASNMGSGVAILKVLMDQYNLGVKDFINEIGSTSLVSLILNGKRNLTIKHIHALALRFKISPKVFI